MSCNTTGFTVLAKNTSKTANISRVSLSNTNWLMPRKRKLENIPQDQPQVISPPIIAKENPVETLPKIHSQSQSENQPQTQSQSQQESQSESEPLDQEKDQSKNLEEQSKIPLENDIQGQPINKIWQQKRRRLQNQWRQQNQQRRQNQRKRGKKLRNQGKNLKLPLDEQQNYKLSNLQPNQQENLLLIQPANEQQKFFPNHINIRPNEEDIEKNKIYATNNEDLENRKPKEIKLIEEYMNEPKIEYNVRQYEPVIEPVHISNSFIRNSYYSRRGK